MKATSGLLCSLLIAALSGIVADTRAQTNQASQTNYWKQIVPGPHLVGYFEGRSPCQGIVKLLNVPDRDDCIKIKWQLVLYKDPVTQAPTTYALGGFAWRHPPKTGKWTLVKGTKENPEAVVYRLKEGHGDDAKEFLSFMKADDNILLFLDHKLDLLIGNESFSYTLNRATLPR